MLINVLTGTLPSKLFWGIQTSESFTGSYENSSTRFNLHDTVKASLYVQGKELSDYLIKMSENHISVLFVKFLQDTDKQNNGYYSKLISMEEYSLGNFILSSTFKPNETGSVSFGFEFEKAIKQDHILVTCSAVERCLKIDHNRNFRSFKMLQEKIIIACLTAEKYAFDLPLEICFTNQKIDEELRNEKLLLIDKFKTISSLESFLESLAYKFHIR
jgi:hypothetical protein